MNLEPDGAAARCRQAAAGLETDRAVQRLWSGDGSLWRAEALARKQIEGSLGWLTLPDRIAPTLPGLVEFASEIRQEADRVLVLGAGGASLGAYVFGKTFGSAEGYPHLEVLDSTEPSAVEAAAARSDPSRTLFVVSSKAGTTLEPNIFFDYFFDHASRELGARAGERFIVITDPGSAVEKEAMSRRVRRIFPGDPQTGSRYAALSNFGLVPAALIGVDVAELVGRARKMADACRSTGLENPALMLGAAIGAEALAGRDKLTFSIGPPADRFGMWLEQLIAESTGKDGKGILPVDREPLGGPEVYGSDRFFIRYDVKGREEAAACSRVATMAEHGHPVASFVLYDALDLGAEMFRWEFATAIAGKIIGVNPFDQPNVHEPRDRASAILAGSSASPAQTPLGVDEKAVAGLLGSMRTGDYFAISAYIDETPETDAALQAMRVRVRNGKRVATTAGYGPRFLHSTGQIHRGGAANGVFLQITCEPSTEVGIPGRPWGFGQVVAAQADGDLASLTSHGRRARRIRLSNDVVPGLLELSKVIDRTVSA